MQEVRLSQPITNNVTSPLLVLVEAHRGEKMCCGEKLYTWLIWGLLAKYSTM